MNIKRQEAMVKSVAKNMRDKERKNANKEKLINKMYEILRKVNKTLDEVTKKDLTEKEYKIIVEYVTEGNPAFLSLYPNLM